MAEKLKRDYDVIVLKTELLDTTSSEPNVRFTLQYKIKGALQNVEQWSGDTRAMGFTERLNSRTSVGTGPPVELPSDVLQGLRSWFEAETEGDRPLWVHLVKPYGVLRFVPWERLLGDGVGVSILMLPDFIFPPPRETASVLDVVLCGSAPLGCEEWSILTAVHLAANRILEAAPRRTRLHIFVDQQFADAVRDQWRKFGRLDVDVFVYAHDLAAKYVAEDPSSRLADNLGTLRSPWLLWMREALRGRGVDVMHFICHGYLSRERGAMLFAQSPLERTDRYLAGPVGATELQTFLTQVGAWSTVFTSVPDNNSEPGLRALADEIAQSRPGPMMMHVMRLDADGVALGRGYHFLYGATPEQPPRSTALFIYCQPYLSYDAAPAPRSIVRTSNVRRAVISDLARNSVQRIAAELADDESPLDPLFVRDENVSSWVASTERFAEQVQLRYQQFARDEILPTEVSAWQTRLAMETIDKLRTAVAADVSIEPETVVAGVTIEPEKSGRGS